MARTRKNQSPIQVSDYDDQKALDKFWRSICRNLDADYRQDAAQMGLQGGFPGYITYHENERTYNRHKNAIWTVIRETAESQGEGQSAMEWMAASNFGKHIENPLYLANYMVWAAVEIMCQEEINRNENEDIAQDFLAAKEYGL